MIWKMLSAPIIGAIIGYCTNWLAVKMLFRPREEKYIGKFRLPFTPGVIPKGKKRLANAVGSVVNEKLLTEQAVQEKLLSDDMIEMVKSSVREYADELKNNESATIGTMLDSVMLIDDAAPNEVLINNELETASPSGDEHNCEECCCACSDTVAELAADTETTLEGTSVVKVEPELSTEAAAMCEVSNYNKPINDMKIFLTKRIFAKVSEANIGNIAAETVNSKLSEAISGSFIGQMMGSSITGMIGPAISQTVDKYIEENGEALIGKMVNDEVDSVLDMRVGNIIESIENSGIDLGEKAAEMYVGAVKKKSGDVLRALDLGDIMRETIENMDNEQLEDLVMSTMKTELGAVVNFGAIIGLLLGLVNMVIYML